MASASSEISFRDRLEKCREGSRHIRCAGGLREIVDRHRASNVRLVLPGGKPSIVTRYKNYLKQRRSLMTLVVMHRSAEPEAIMMYADSRVSAEHSPLTDAAAKLFPLPVTVSNERQAVFRSSFGFAFAGSTLAAHSIYAFAAAALQGLRVERGKQIPALEEVAIFVATYAKEYVVELGTRSGRLPQCEIAIGGYCPVSRKMRLFIARPQLSDAEVEMEFGELDITSHRHAYHLGSDQAWEAFRHATGSRGLEPAHALESIILDPQFLGVGGSVQVLRADKGGARNLPTLHRGPNGASLRLLGKPIEEFGSVGGCNFRHQAFGLFD